MRGMKITVDAAMRARDVSRPRAEHEALARESDAAAGPAGGDPTPAGAAGPAETGHTPAPADVAAAGPGRASRPGAGRRRRRRR